jgi:hypothetical protein
LRQGIIERANQGTQLISVEFYRVAERIDAFHMDGGIFVQCYRYIAIEQHHEQWLIGAHVESASYKK